MSKRSCAAAGSVADAFLRMAGECFIEGHQTKKTAQKKKQRGFGKGGGELHN